MPLYESVPQLVDALQWTGDNADAVIARYGDKVRFEGRGLELSAGVDGVQDWVPVPVGHWVVGLPNDDSDLWPVAANYFVAKYRRMSV